MDVRRENTDVRWVGFHPLEYLLLSPGQSSNLYLNVVHFFNASVNKTSVAA
jgi:hypothetical protein